MIAAKAKEPGKAKTEAPAQQRKQAPASPQAPAFNPLWQQLALGVQAKLAVSAPDDPLEREADAVADRVMRMAEPSVQRKCAACEEEEKLQRKESRSTPDTTATISPLVHEALSTTGQPLDSATRDFFEPRFGHDFGSVRVHADRQASEAAQGVAAQAFTVGHDIVFGSGHYAPETKRGRQLLAHELTHVVQQGGEPLQRARTPAKERAAPGGAPLGQENWPFNFLSTMQRRRDSTHSDGESEIGADFRPSAEGPMVKAVTAKRLTNRTTVRPETRLEAGGALLANQVWHQLATRTTAASAASDGSDPGLPPLVQHHATPPFLPLTGITDYALKQTSRVQAKLSISQPGDADEQEADRGADQVMRNEKLASIGSAPGMAERKCVACEAAEAPCRQCEEEKQIWRKALPDAEHTSPAPPTVPRGGGQPLAAPVRAYFESRFGMDLGRVRVHTDDTASRAAAAISARAFTSGSDIAFARDQFAPETSEGKRLLAHELTHVVQQANGQSSPRIARDKDPRAAPTPASPVLLGFGGAPEKCYVPRGPTTTFEGILLASNAEYLDEVLCDYIAKHGEDAASEFVKRFHDKVADDVKDLPGAGAGDDPAAKGEYGGNEEQQTASRIWRSLAQALPKRLANNKQWLARFEAKANDVVLGMLQESEDRVREEMIRYGIDWKQIEYTDYEERPRGGYRRVKSSYTRYSMPDTPGSRALAEAATGLLNRKRAFDKADKEMEDYADEAFSGATAFAELGIERGFASGLTKKRDHLNELRAVRNHAKRDLDVFRIQKSAEFPILAAYASDEKISESSLEKLQELAKGKSSAATDMMGAEIKSRLEHIAEVRKDITENGGKETKIWRVPRIIEGTRAMTGATPGTMYGRLVDDKVKDEAPGFWTSILLGLLQLVLVLAAPFTGGLTLIPAAAISIGQAYTHFREYERAQMLRGTDFGALALSSEDPSLFWLAVDIIGAGFDVGAAAGAAVKLFRALAPAARAARAAKTAEAAEEAARALERSASELGGEALAKTVGRDARLGSEAMKVGETAEEARALARAGEQMAETELKAGAEVAESIAGRQVKVAESGGLWSCASPCTLLRERYKGLLRRKGTDWEKRLKDLEDEAARIPKGKAGAEARKAVADRAAALEREMRTTALPGEWTSPLKDAEEFKELVKRRGSIAAELDHHPPNWTGKDEARFRYGEKIDAEPGYRWTLDENGALRYDRLDASLPAHRYNPAMGTFEEAAEGSTLIKATKGAEETREFADIPAKERKAMEAAFKKRGDLIAERDRLEALAEAGKTLDKDRKNIADKLKSVYAKINEESRQMGENAAEAVMKGKGGKKVYPIGKSYSTAGDFDQVWKKGDRFQLVEAKGGSSGLGSRAVGEGVRAEQGTVEYARSIAENMAKNGATKEIRKLGRDLLAAIADGKVDYILVRAPIGEKLGKAVISDVKVSEFVLK